MHILVHGVGHRPDPLGRQVWSIQWLQICCLYDWFFFYLDLMFCMFFFWHSWLLIKPLTFKYMKAFLNTKWWWAQALSVILTVIDTLFVSWNRNIIFWYLQVIHFITFYMPLWGAILFNGLTYFQVIRMLNNATRVSTHPSFLFSEYIGPTVC